MNKAQTIGICHYQLGMTDGVSLEVEKWQTVLERMGHRVVLFAGRFGQGEGVVLPDLYHHNPEIVEINRNIFRREDTLSSPELEALISKHTKRIKANLRRAFIEYEIDLLLVNNLWSVAMNIPAAIALEEIRQELGLRMIAHHHDFYWEKVVQPDMTNPLIAEIFGNYFPPLDPAIGHVVINSLAQASLQKCKGLPSTIVPNVFDFDGPDWIGDDYNRDFREKVGLAEGDICLLQATRIVPRKGIELAIDLVAALNEPQRRAQLVGRELIHGGTFGPENKIVLILAGYERDDPTGTYLQRLKLKAEKMDVDLRHIHDLVGPARIEVDGKKIYSLWDTYTLADFVTYPSLWEGWGNQLLEAFRAKLPIALFEYPVYLADIKAKGFDVVSLGAEVVSRDDLDFAEISTKMLQEAADQCVAILTDRSLREEAVSRNYQIAKEHYSYDTLREILMVLI
jgi:glycosyltransferase involved in cell wall biosynthesis